MSRLCDFAAGCPNPGTEAIALKVGTRTDVCKDHREQLLQQYKTTPL